MFKRKAWLAGAIILIVSFTVLAADDAKPKEAKSKRTTSLSFEDELVEGLNKNPLDSLESTSKKDARDQPHLYKKREDFRKEMKFSQKEQRYTP